MGIAFCRSKKTPWYTYCILVVLIGILIAILQPKLANWHRANNNSITASPQTTECRNGWFQESNITPACLDEVGASALIFYKQGKGHYSPFKNHVKVTWFKNGVKRTAMFNVVAGMYKYPIFQADIGHFREASSVTDIGGFPIINNSELAPHIQGGMQTLDPDNFYQGWGERHFMWTSAMAIHRMVA